MDKRQLIIGLAIGAVVGWIAAAYWQGRNDTPAPSVWLARVGDSYITEPMFIAEMQRRGGQTPGQYQDMVQKRALLDDMVLRRAMVNAAQNEHIDDDPDVGYLLDQALVNQYLQRSLRAQQQKIVVTDAEVRAHYDAHAADYVVPARRRVAMIQLKVAESAGEEVWKAAEARAGEALGKARKLDAAVTNFGVVAREYSEDQASRYRGGMIGWISDGQLDRYRYDPVVLQAAVGLAAAGDVSEPLRGKDGVYLVRVVEVEPMRERQFEQLSTGIHQRLLQDKLRAAEEAFREDLRKRSAIEIREAGLERIVPLAPPAEAKPPQPPAMPAS